MVNLNHIRKNKGFWFLFSAILLWIIVLLFFSPEEIVSIIGLETGYLSIFLTALFGVSGFAAAPFYITFFTLVSTGEFSIIILIILIAPARTIGDFVIFFLGYKGNSVIKNLAGDKLKNLSIWLKEKPYWMIPVVIYFYTSFTFLPQDILMIFLGLGKAKKRQVFVAVLFGNATFVAIAYFISQSFYLN